MDFSNHVSQSQHSGMGSQPMSSMSSGNNKKSKDSWSQNMVIKWANLFMTVAVVVVLIGLLVFVVYNKGTTNPAVDNEGSLVQTSKLQAVFLNTGQVYFGNVTAYNVNYLVLTNIFYLQSNSSSSTSSSSSSSNNVTLVKLGCELHAPLDQMVINRSSVTFWENLSPSGQVAKAVATWEKENPNGQKCSDQSTAGTSGTTSTQNTTK